MYRENRVARVVDENNALVVELALNPEFDNEDEREFIANYILENVVVANRVVIIDNGYVVANYNI